MRGLGLGVVMQVFFVSYLAMKLSHAQLPLTTAGTVVCACVAWSNMTC